MTLKGDQPGAYESPVQCSNVLSVHYLHDCQPDQTWLSRTISTWEKIPKNESAMAPPAAEISVSEASVQKITAVYDIKIEGFDEKQ